jgi:exosortase O
VRCDLESVLSLKSHSVSCSPSRVEWAALVPLGNALLVGSWLWLCRPTLGWLARSLVAPDARTNGILLAGALLILLLRARGSVDLRRLPFCQARLRPLPLALFAGCALGQCLKSHLLDSNLLASMGFAIGSHALAGLYLAPSQWRRGWVLALFAVALLPFGPHLDAFLGFPTRIATAHLVEQVLHASGVPVQSTEAILIFENGVASIDLPCSGVKGLWVGGIFFLALTGIEKRELGLRWLLAGVAFMACLAAANFTRVLLLVVIGFAFGQPALAGLVHLPLGVFGFVVACGLAIVLLRRLPRHGGDRPCATPEPSPLRVGAFLLAGILMTFAAARTAERPLLRPIQPAAIYFPSDWTVTSLPLDTKEALLFERHDGHQAGKWRFQVGQATGSLLVVVANSFRAHHAPEVCLAGVGHRVDGIRREALAVAMPIKFIDIDHHQATAATWFQSASATTDSLIERTLAEYFHGERRWALVSVLFDRQATLDRATSALLQQLHAAVGASLHADNRKGS